MIGGVIVMTTKKDIVATGAAGGKPKIEIFGIHKSYFKGEQQFEALKGIDLTISHGEFIGLVGPSGSGKTTLLNLIGGLDEPTGGSIVMEGRDLSHLTSEELSDFRNFNVGFIFQAYNLLPVYTAYENVEFPLLLQKNRKPAKIRELVTAALDKVGLSDKMGKKPGELSGGECQRVAIARAIVKEPSLVLADEPTANLDAENSHAILKIMENLNSETGTTFIFSTHDEKVMAHLKRMVRLTDGIITEDLKLDAGEKGISALPGKK